MRHQTRHRHSAVAAIAAVMVVSAAVGPAQAQTTIGQTPPAPINFVVCTGNLTFVQALTAGPPSYEVPAGDWLLTSWSHMARSGAGQSLKLKVFRPVGDPLTTNTYTVVGQDGPRSLTPSSLNTFNVDPPLAVQPGDLLGLFVTTTNNVECTVITGVAADAYRFDNDQGDVAPGGQVITDTTTGTFRLNVSATLVEVEIPDTVAPDTTIIEGPKDKTKKKRATFEFTSSEAGATFECSFDNGAFAPCTSPETEKVKKGRHSFEVRATDAAGNVDASPASDAWKVKKKRKKKH